MNLTIYPSLLSIALSKSSPRGGICLLSYPGAAVHIAHSAPGYDAGRPVGAQFSPISYIMNHVSLLCFHFSLSSLYPLIEVQRCRLSLRHDGTRVVNSVLLSTFNPITIHWGLCIFANCPLPFVN